MPITNKQSLGNARTVLSSLRDCLKAVANGEDGEAVQTLKSLVGGSDESFEDTLDGTETLASLVVDAHKALASDVDDEDEDYEDSEDEDEEDYEDEDEDDVEESKVKTSKTKKRPLLTASVAAKRTEFLDMALADTEDLEDFEIDETEGNDVDATLGGAEDEYSDEDEQDAEEDLEESKVTAKVKQRQKDIAKTKTQVATPKKKKVVAKTKTSDGRL